MGYTLGVDLGTTYTAAAIRRGDRLEVADLGTRAAVMPSVVYLRDDGAVLTGEAALRRGVTDPGRMSREYKRRMGDTTAILLGGVPWSVDGLMARMLQSVVAAVSERQGERPDAIAVAHPANWGPYKKDLLEQAVRRADLDHVAFITEPEAAAVHYATLERLETGDTVAVYDLGGGTFDAAVLRKTADGFELIGEPEGIERLGGIDFDEAVFRHVLQALGGVVAELDQDDPVVQSGVSRLRDECVAAKEALSSDTEVSIPVILPNVHTDVRLTRSEFEAMIRPALADTLVVLQRALRSAGVRPDELHSVLLVGGSSRIPLIAQLVSAELGRPVALDVHPKHSVALGAAVVAGGGVGGAGGTGRTAPSASAPTASAPTASAPTDAVPPAPTEARLSVPAAPVTPGNPATVSPNAAGAAGVAAAGVFAAPVAPAPPTPAPPTPAPPTSAPPTPAPPTPALPTSAPPTSAPPMPASAAAPAVSAASAASVTAGTPAPPSPPGPAFTPASVSGSGGSGGADGSSATGGAGGAGSKKPLLIGAGVAALVALVVVGVIALGGGGDGEATDETVGRTSDVSSAPTGTDASPDATEPDSPATTATTAAPTTAAPASTAAPTTTEAPVCAGVSEPCIQLDAVNVRDGAIEVSWTPFNFEPDINEYHAHLYWNDVTAEQSGNNGVEGQRDWDAHDDTIHTSGLLVIATKPPAATEVCITVGLAPLHNTPNPKLFDCEPLPG